MKPFDLEKALAGEPVVTRNGKTVSDLKRFDAHAWCIAGVIELGRLGTWTADGGWKLDGESPLDLFMADKPKRTVRAYVRVQKKASGLIAHCASTALEIGEDEAIEPCDGWQTVEFDLEVE